MKRFRFLARGVWPNTGPSLLFAICLTVSSVGCSRSASDDELSVNLYNWSQYLPEGFLARFERETGIRVVEDFYGSNEEMLARVEGGNPGFDLVVPGGYMVEIMISKNLLAPIDSVAVPNLANIDARYANPPYDPGLRHCAPFTVGTNGLGINVERLPNAAVPSWRTLFEPPPEASGRIMLLDDARMTIGAALKYLGFSFNSTSATEINQARDLLIGLKPNIMAFDAANYMQFLGTGETWIAYGYSGDIAQASAENPSVRYLVPREGTVFWVDSYCVLADAPHPTAAARFINFLLEPRNHAEVLNYLRYASPSRGALEFIGSDVLADPAVYPPDSVIQKSEFIRDVGDAIRLYQDAWTAIKAR